MNRHDRRAAARSICENYRPTIRCATHGPSPWRGEIICTACNAVWKLDGDDRLEPPVEIEGRCTCGAELCGDKGTARVICADCFAARRPPAAPRAQA